MRKSLLAILRNSTVQTFIKILILVTVCSYIYSIVEWSEVINLFKNISPGYFLLALLICFFDQVFMALKWQVLLRMFKIKVPIIVPIAAYLGGRAVSVVIPSGVGIDAYKTYYLKKHGIAATSTISSIIIERFIGIFSSLAIIGLLLYFPLLEMNVSNRLGLSICGISLFIIVTALIFVLVKYSYWFGRAHLPKFIPLKISTKLTEISQTLSEIKDYRNSVFVYYFASIIEKLFYGTAIFFAARSVGVDSVNYVYIIGATPFLALLERIPISFAAIGVREGLFVALFRPFISDPAVPISIALALRAAELVLIGLSLLLWIKEGVGRRRLKLMEREKREAHRLETAEIGVK